MKRSVIVTLGIALIAGVACGGGDNGGDGTETQAEATPTPSPESLVPEPTESIEAFAEEIARVANAAAAGDCDVVEEFNDENDAYQFNCGADASGAENTEITGTEEYGSAGVIDHTSAEAPDGGSYVVYVDAEGQWRLAQALITGEATVGTPETDLESRTETLDRAIQAVIDKDCDTFFDLWFTPTPNKAKECEIAFDEEGTFQPELAADPEAEPMHLGGNSWFSFFGLATDPGHYRTMYTFPREPGGSEYLVDSLRIK